MEASKIAKVGLLLAALGGVGFGIYYFAKKQQAGASQTFGQGTMSGAEGANIPSPGSCPTCGGGIPSAPSQPSQPSPPSTPGASYPPPNISTLTGLISGQLKPEAPTPALQVLLGQSTTVQPWLTLGPIKIYF
jgi:hypothetical protein